jgi:hypothetical protein
LDGSAIAATLSRTHQNGPVRPLLLVLGALAAISSGGRAAQAIATVEVPEDGRYEITVTDSADAPSPAVVLGKPITRRILRLVVGIAGSVVGLALLGLVARSPSASRYGAARRLGRASGARR